MVLSFTLNLHTGKQRRWGLAVPKSVINHIKGGWEVGVHGGCGVKKKKRKKKGAFSPDAGNTRKQAFSAVDCV